MLPDISTLVALTGLVTFFVGIVFLWISVFRHYGARTGESMVTTIAPETDEEELRNVRIVEVPIAGAVDGGPALGGRVMQIAERDTGQRRTVRKMIAPTFPSSSPSLSDLHDLPDETPPVDVAQQQTQVLPALPVLPAARLRLGGTWRVAVPEPLPCDFLN